MIVGLDARKLRDGGIGTYIRELLAARATAQRGHQYVALLDPADVGRTVRPDGTASGVREVTVRAGKYGLGEHIAIPRAAKHAGAQLLHAPHYTLPLGWTGPSVVTIHDLIHVRFPQFIPPGASLYARAMAGVAARRARLVLVDSVHGQREVVELLRVPQAKVRVIPLGVSSTLAPAPVADVAAFRTAHGLPSGYLLYVGARKPHKNLPVLLRAVAAIPASLRPPLVLSGQPWSTDEPMARLSVQLGLSGTLFFSGALAGEGDLARLYSGAALYAQPSLDEGFGLPPLEAMACGTPVIASSAGAMPEVLGDDVASLPTGEIEAWSAAIVATLADTALRERRVHAGLVRARAFTFERTANGTLDAYEEALRG